MAPVQTWLAIACAVLAFVVVLLVRWIGRLRRRLRELASARQSQSTRYGQITEQFAPFMADWPWDPKRFRFLGNPVDGVQFTDDGIVFVEIKSANSQLNSVQRQVRDHVAAGRVAWQVVRIG